MAQVEEFIAKFHALEGQLIGQRQKSFYKLLAEYEPLKDNKEALDVISSTLTPKNYLESLFKVDFLIYFKRVPELIEYLKGGNDVYISKIAKQVWFFKSAFNETPVDELVNEILPTMSYCVRAKILTNLSKYSSSERFDLIFDALVARYGISFASNYLLGCSETKIKTILKDYIINDLSAAHLKILYIKNPDLIRIYFENHAFDLRKHKKFFIFVHAEDLKLFKELEEKLKFNLKLGRRNTKKFFIAHKDEIIKKPVDYIDKIDMKTVIRKLGAESEILIKNTLPNKIQDVDDYTKNFKKIEHFIPSKYLYKTYFYTIQNYYNEKICDYSDLIKEDLLKIIPDENERVQLAKIKVDDSVENFVDFVPYLTSQEAISLIKSKLNLTSADRSTLVQALVKTCGINKDLKSFLQVLKYFYARHKNDGKLVILKFLNSIRVHFNFKDFNEEIWIALRDIMAVHALKYGSKHETQLKEILNTLEANSALYSEFLMYCYVDDNYGQSEMLRLYYMEYMFKHGKLTEESIVNFLCCTNICFWERSDYDKEFIAHLVKSSVTNLEKIAKYRKMELNDYALELILLLDSKICRNKNITFYDFPILVEYFYKIALSGEYVLYQIRRMLRDKLFTLEDNPYKAKNLEIYCSDRHQHFYDNSDLKWLLRYQPQILVDNFDKLKSDILDTLKLAHYLIGKRTKIPYDIRFIHHLIKKFSHLGLDQLVINQCKSILENDPDKIASIRCLSILLPSQEYIDIANAFKPTNTKIDLKDDSVKDYQVMYTIAENFKYTNDYKALDSLLNYFCGDFLQYALVSFSALIYKTPEIQLEKYLEFLRNSPAVSVRKHCFFYTRLLCDSDSIKKMFKSVISSEKDDSLQRRIFESLLNHFAKNPQECFYELIKTCLTFIKEEDTELLQKVNEIIPKIALKYRAAFLVYMWKYLEKLITKPKTLRDLKIGLLHRIDAKCAADIPLDFAVKIIQQNLSKCDNNSIPHKDIADFAFTILTNKKDNIQILDAIFDIINAAKVPRDLYWIHHKWTFNILKLKKEQNIDFLQHYITYWQSKLDPVEDFNGYLYLFFVQLKAEFHAEFSLEKIADKIVHFYEKIIADYDLFVMNFLKEALEQMVQYLRDDTMTDFDFYYYIVSNYQSPGIIVMIIDILPCKEEENSSQFEIHKKIVEKIKTFKEPAIRINATKFCDY